MKHRSLPTPIVIIMIAWFSYFFFWKFYTVWQFSNAIAPTWDIKVKVIIFQVCIISVFASALIRGIIGKFKKTGLLQCCMAATMFLSPFIILETVLDSTPFNFIKSESNISRMVAYGWIAMEIIFLPVCTIGFRILSKNRIPKYNDRNTDGKIARYFYYTSWGKRLLNSVVDSSVYFYAIVITCHLLGMDDKLMSFFSIATLVVEIPLSVIYYSFFESVFHCTPGKCLTNSTVVNEFGEYPEFSEIVKRSLCRLIPLDAFSFLGYHLPRGWHDSLSETYVVNATDIDAEKPEGIFRKAEVEF